MPLPPELRFDHAQYRSLEPSRELGQCAFCGRQLDADHFEVLNRVACEICGKQALSHLPVDSQQRFFRALGAGSIVALAGGLVLVALLVAMPSISARIWAGYFGAIALGWALGKTMRFASQNVGGRRYQIAAAFLTYCAVIYPMQLTLHGVPAVPGYLYPLILLRPVVFLFRGLAAIGTWQLVAGFLGARLAWSLMRGLPVMVRSVRSGSNGKP